MFSPSEISEATVSAIFLANGHGYPIGVPFCMHDANAMVSAPLSKNSRALRTAFFPGQPPQFINPIISISSVTSENAPPFSRIILKHVVPGQKSSVCIHLIIPTFTLYSPLALSSFYTFSPILSILSPSILSALILINCIDINRHGWYNIHRGI